MTQREKLISSQYIYKGRILSLRKDEVLVPNGHRADREIIEHCGGVAVAALNSRGELLFVRQYRNPYDEFVLELPAGKLEPNEDPAEAGRRELREETGYEAEVFEPLGRAYPSPGYTDETVSLFFARELTFVGQHTDEDEFLSVETIPLERAAELVLRGEIPDAKTQIGVLKVKFLVERNFKI